MASGGQRVCEQFLGGEMMPDPSMQCTMVRANPVTYSVSTAAVNHHFSRSHVGRLVQKGEAVGQPCQGWTVMSGPFVQQVWSWNWNLSFTHRCQRVQT